MKILDARQTSQLFALNGKIRPTRTLALVTNHEAVAREYEPFALKMEGGLFRGLYGT